MHESEASDNIMVVANSINNRSVKDVFPNYNPIIIYYYFYFLVLTLSLKYKYGAGKTDSC